MGKKHGSASYTRPRPKLSPAKASGLTDTNPRNRTLARIPTSYDCGMDWHGKHVLIIESDKPAADMLVTTFEQHGAIPQIVRDYIAGLESLRANPPDLLVLDMRLPGANGFEVLKNARRISDVPVIILLGVSQYELLIRCLLAGADDFIQMPLRRDELLARSWVAFSRIQERRMPIRQKNFHDGYLAIELDSRTVRVNGEPVSLTDTEFRLLSFLVRRRDRTCTFQEIINHVWNGDRRDSVDIVHVFIWQIRQKIEIDPREPSYLLNEHGVGYRFNGRQAAIKG